MRRRPSRHLLSSLVLSVAAVALVGCGDSSSSSSKTTAAKSAAEAQVTVPASIPKGVTLRVGDQLDYLKTVLNLSAQDKDFGYTVEYSAFIGGPPMLQAFQAGAIDTGFVGSTPLIFAQAQQQDIVAIAGFAPQHSGYGLVTSPGSKIKGWKDLEGKKVAYQQGTAGEAALLQALDTAGLKLADITPVNVPQTQVSATLQSGSADAGISVEPLTSTYLAANPTAALVARPDELTDRSSFIIATKSAIENTGTQAALADYLTRLAKGFNYLASHPDQIADAVYVKQYHLSPERAKELITAAGFSGFFTLPGDILEPQQRLADLFYANGEIPSKVDVTSQFDPRFNDVVQKAQAT